MPDASFGPDPGRLAEAAAIAATEERATPAAVHLAGLAPGSRPSTAAAFTRAARIAAGNDHADGLAFPWHRRPPDTLAAVRGRLAGSYAVSTANASLAAIRGALRAAWLAGELSRDGYERRSAALKRVGGRPAPGRVLNAAQVGKLFRTAADDPNAATGARDAALLAVLYGLGLRRAEAAVLELADLDPDAGTLRVRGKGRRERLAHLGTDGAAAAVSGWLAVRGNEPGPFLRAVNKGGRVLPGGMSPRAIGKRVATLGARAGLGTVSPHVLRRSFGTALLAAGNDLATVADCMGHASTDTTRNHYDRRGEAAKAAAMSTIPVPYVARP